MYLLGCVGNSNEVFQIYTFFFVELLGRKMIPFNNNSTPTILINWLYSEVCRKKDHTHSIIAPKTDTHNPIDLNNIMLPLLVLL